MMRRNAVILLFAMVAICSCKKDEETQLSMTDELSRQWEVVKYEVNGSDETATFESLFPEYSVDFNSDGTYTEYYFVLGVLVPVNGTWLFMNNNTEIQMTDPDQTRLYHIMKLTTTELTVEDANTAAEDIFYLQPK
jgi:hypothetical protein